MDQGNLLPTVGIANVMVQDGEFAFNRLNDLLAFASGGRYGLYIPWNYWSAN